MADEQLTQSPDQSHNNKRKILVIIIPLISCGLSSLLGIFIGQVGNLIYRFIGDAAACLSVPGFVVLFLLTFGLSFFSNRFLKRIFNQRGK